MVLGTTIPAGTQVLSGPLRMRMRPLTELAVSVYLPAAAGPATYHSDAQQNNYIAGGDHSGDAAAAAYTTTAGSWYFADGLDVYSGTADGTLVAFGDSITDGYQNMANAVPRSRGKRAGETKFGHADISAHVRIFDSDNVILRV
jgi:hypothetical protein